MGAYFVPPKPSPMKIHRRWNISYNGKSKFILYKSLTSLALLLSL
jgi:hypothetical protein